MFRYGWILPLKEHFLEALIEEIRTAPTSTFVYPSATTVINVVLPVPQQPMRLEPLPAHLPGRATPPAPDHNAMPGAGQNEPDDEWDEEEDDEIRPVSDERAAQWRAYRAAGF